MSPSRRIWTYLYRYRRRYAGGIVALVAAAACSLSIPWTLKSAVDALERDGREASLGFYVLLIVLLAVGNGIFRLCSRFAILGAGQWVEHDVRDDLYQHLQTLPPAFYHRYRTGDLMSRASSDVSALRGLSGIGVVMLVGTSLTFVGTIGAMWSIDPLLMLYAMSPFPVLVLVVKRFNHQVETRSIAVQEQLGVLSTRVQENLTGMPVVRAYTMEERETSEFERANREYLTRSIALARTQAISWPLMGLISGMGALVVLWLGGMAVVNGRISLGDFVAFNGYLAQLAWPTIALGWTLSSVRRGVASMRRVGEVMAAPPSTDHPETMQASSQGAEDPRVLPKGDIEFRDLTFFYDG